MPNIGRVKAALARRVLQLGVHRGYLASAKYLEAIQTAVALGLVGSHIVVMVIVLIATHGR